MECPKPHKLIDHRYKYWLIQNGRPLTAAFPELVNIIPLKFVWGGPVNHHLSCERKRDDWQVRVPCGAHRWFHEAEGIKWESEHLDELKKFAEGEYSRYLQSRGKP